MCSTITPADFILGKIKNGLPYDESIKKLLILALDEQTYELFGKNIRIVPKLVIDKTVENYVIISFDNFTPNGTNPEFRDHIISFDIICHFDQWHL